MSLLVVPATAADLPNAIQIEHDAYASNPFTPILFPGPFAPQTMSSRVDEVLQEWKEDPTTHWMKVIDTDLDEFTKGETAGESEMNRNSDRKGIAFAKWNLHEQPPMSKQGRQFGEGCNTEACEKLFGSLRNQSQRLMPKEGGYMYLQHLHVHPSHQRRGAGGLLLKWGQDMARKRDMKVFLNASSEGHGLYLKNGFRDIECHEVDMSQWGGGVHRTWVMVWDESMAPS